MKKGLVEVEVDLTDDIFMKIARMAHEKNFTFNKMCVEILNEEIKKENKKK
jgi:hypothetical protein